MSMKRRSFLKSAMMGAGAVAGATLLPQTVFAKWASDEENPFKAKTTEDALSKLLGAKDATPSDAITVKAPDIAENGAVVPISITVDKSKLADVESISLVATENPTPLVASFSLAASHAGFVSTRIKMGKTSDVVAIVKAGGKLYSAKKNVKVTVGGCGG